MSERPARSQHGVYSISVAAELVGTAAQNLRVYERHGLLEPQRTPGGTRRYSDHDVARLQRISQLLDDGLNLAGVAMVLQLEADVDRLREQRDHARAQNRGRTGGPDD